MLILINIIGGVYAALMVHYERYTAVVKTATLLAAVQLAAAIVDVFSGTYLGLLRVANAALWLYVAHLASDLARAHTYTDESEPTEDGL